MATKITFVCAPSAEVKLVSVSEDAARTLATVTRGYKGIYDLEITDAEIEDMLQQSQKTKLGTPIEFIQTVWLIRDVSRAFTHQLVRTRVGAEFVQESLRFSDKCEAKVLVPPRIWTHQELRQEYKKGILASFEAYDRLLDKGVSMEEARYSLPHGVLTHVFCGFSLSTLARIYETRTCCQAQHTEWLSVVRQMKEQLPEKLQGFLKTPWETGATSCGFNASFDRVCKYKKAFANNPEYAWLKADLEKDSPNE